jgi:predicted AAA+ superfamily ATPase
MRAFFFPKALPQYGNAVGIHGAEAISLANFVSVLESLFLLFLAIPKTETQNNRMSNARPKHCVDIFLYRDRILASRVGDSGRRVEGWLKIVIGNQRTEKLTK